MLLTEWVSQCLRNVDAIYIRFFVHAMPPHCVLPPTISRQESVARVEQEAERSDGCALGLSLSCLTLQVWVGRIGQ